MTTKRMKSNEVRVDWADVLQFVRTGGTVVVEHYNKAVATITPYAEENTVLHTEKLADQIRATLGDKADDFDVDAIAEEIGDTYGRDTASVDAIPSEEYWAIVEKHDTITTTTYTITADSDTVRWLTATTGLDRLGGDSDTRYGLEDLGDGRVGIPASTLPDLMELGKAEDGCVTRHRDGRYVMWIEGLGYDLTPAG